MEITNKGIHTDTLYLIAGATFLLLFLIDINPDSTLERVIYYLGVPLAAGYISSVIGWDLEEEKDKALANILMYVIGVLFIALFINSSVNEKKTIKACSGGNQDACEALEYSRQQREGYRE